MDKKEFELIYHMLETSDEDIPCVVSTSETQGAGVIKNAFIDGTERYFEILINDDDETILIHHYGVMAEYGGKGE